MKFKKIHIIINPAAGKERPILYTLNRIFTHAGIDWDISVTKKFGDARHFALQAVSAGAEAVGVYGGDGTVMEVAGALATNHLPMFILRGGTANIIASELNIPSDLAQACKLVLNPHVQTRILDVGKMGDLYFLLRVSIGLEASVVKRAVRDLKEQVGTWAYAISAFRAILGTRHCRYHIKIDGHRREVEGVTCLIANSRSLGVAGLALAPNIFIDDGQLDIIVIRGANFNSLFSRKTYVIDRRRQTRSFYHWKGREVEISCEPAQEVQCDGEFLGHRSVEVKILPKALHILAPKK